MAFGFLKKLVAAVTGSKGGSTAKGKGVSSKDAAGAKGGRSHRGRHGRHGRDKDGAPSSSGDSQARSQQGGRDKRREAGRASASNAPHREEAKGGSPARSDRGGRRGERRGERGRDGRRNRAGAPVNTAADEMRPGGEVSAEERQRRAAAHAAWDPASFTVDPQEGKKRFQDFDLPSEVMHGIADLGFQYCTDIQALSLQHALDGKNVAGKAQTGSGKTAAFLVAILTRYLRTPDRRAEKGGCPRALVLAPTRELVIQICKDADAIGKYSPLRSLAIYGGMDYDRQRREILAAPVDLLVATPGRLLDFCNQRVIDLSKVDTLVIDEADRMLDMGFIPDVRRIMAKLPPKDRRTTMLYSATLTDDVMRLASQWMAEPVKVEVESDHNATDTVRQVVYVIRAEDKFKVLFNHIALHPESRAIVFCNRKSTTEDVYESLKCRGVSCEMLSGDVNQNRRLKVLDALRDNEVKIVVATDVAGRGIDIKDLEYVINFDFPYEAEDYVHRIGRTGRAGSTGIAISFADEDESFAIPEIEEYIKEPLGCTMIGSDDPLLKDLPPRHTTLGAVDETAKAEVDAREAVTEAQKAAALAVIGAGKVGVTVTNGDGREGVVVLDDGAPRPMPTFEHALEPKKDVDESDVYSKPVAQTARFEEWNVTPAPETAPAPAPETAPAPASEAVPAPETAPAGGAQPA